MTNESSPTPPRDPHSAEAWGEVAAEAQTWPDHEGVRALRHNHLNPLLEQKGLGHLVTDPGDAVGSSEDKKDPLKTVLVDTVNSAVEAHRNEDDVLDGLIGGLVALGGVVTSSGDKVEPIEVLEDLSRTTVIRPDPYAPKTSIPDKELAWFTSTNGLQPAVKVLASSARTSRLFPAAKDRLAITFDGRVVMTSPAQVKSYLEVLSLKAGNTQDDWHKAFIDEMTLGDVDSQGMKYALDVARSVGADIDLLAASSQYYKSRKA